MIAFIFADLIVLPILNIYRKYYGGRMTVLLFVTSYVAMAAAGLLVELLFMAVGAVPRERAAQIVEPHITLNYTTVLNIIFLGLAAVLLIRFSRTNGLAMLRMMNGLAEKSGATHSDDRGDVQDLVTDPVCGMSIGRQQARGAAEHHGKRFYFCSPDCLRRFEASPDRYVRHSA